VRGLFYGDASQLLAQVIAIVVLLVWGFLVSLLFYKLLDKVWGIRVAPDIELEGLDIPEMGVLAYPDEQLVRSELDFDSDDNAPVRQLARFEQSALIRMPAPVTLAAAPVPTAVAAVAERKPGAAKFTKVEIITKQSKFEALKTAMNDIGITGMTVTQVLGYGLQKGKTEFYRGVETEPNLLPKVQVEIVVSLVPVRTVVETAKKVLYTGSIGDGKIFVYDVENVIKVRTGEEGYAALQDVE